MTTYNTYQEAKIDNPESEVYILDYLFTCEPKFHSFALSKCNPADYCIAVEQFFKDGHELVKGDIVFEGRVKKLFNEAVARSWNEIQPKLVPNAYVLRAAALETTIPTQTPEEKEALDLIDTTPHQYEMSKFGGEKSEWKNGDECVIRGEKLIYIGESIEADIHCVQEFGTCIYRNAHVSVIEKPESPEAKEKREKLEAAYDLYFLYAKAVDWPIVSMDEFKENHPDKDAMLAIVDKTNYRKGE